MKKTYGLGWVVMLVVLFMAMFCQAASWRPLPTESKAQMGATHVAVITYADLASGATNTFVLTNAVPAAKQGYELVGMVLVTPFVDNATNGHNSTAIKVGDGDDDDLYLTSTELNIHGTEVYVKFPREDRTFSTTKLTNSIVYLNATTNLATNTIVYVSAAADAGSDFGRKLYTAAGAIKTTFTGTSPYPLSALAAGEVRLYFRVWDAAKQNP